MLRPVLDILHTHPSHQGRGAGTALTKWGTDLADKQHLQCYLEASSSGHRLFRKMDFHDVAEMEIDLNRYRAGYGNGIYMYKHVVMIRPPDMPPKVPPKDERRASAFPTVVPVHVVENGVGGGHGVEKDVDPRSRSMGDTPNSEGVGGWDFGLLDQSHFGGETESNYMDIGKRDSEYSESNRSSLI